MRKRCLADSQPSLNKKQSILKSRENLYNQLLKARNSICRRQGDVCPHLVSGLPHPIPSQRLRTRGSGLGDAESEPVPLQTRLFCWGASSPARIPKMSALRSSNIRWEGLKADILGQWLFMAIKLPLDDIDGHYMAITLPLTAINAIDGYNGN